MSKLTEITATKRIIVIIGIAASLMVSIIAFSVNSHSASAQGLTSSLKQKASSMLSSGANKTGAGNMTNSSNSTASSLKQKAAGIIGKITK